MGSITRSFANNIGSSGILTASAVTNATIEDITSFDNAASSATLVLLSTQTASSSANISFTTGLDSTYDEYIFKFINIHNETNYEFLSFNLSTDGGANYNVTKTTTMFFAYHNEPGTATSFAYNSSNDLAQGTGIAKISMEVRSANADDSLSGSMTLFNPSSTTYVKHFISNVTHAHSDTYTCNTFSSGYGNTTSAVNAIRFQMSSGNIDDGIIKMYGVKKS